MNGLDYFGSSLLRPANPLAFQLLTNGIFVNWDFGADWPVDDKHDLSGVMNWRGISNVRRGGSRTAAKIGIWTACGLFLWPR
jgi:hypothetical protein